MIRFEISGDLQADWGATSDQMAALLTKCDVIRDGWREDASANFLNLPERIHGDYQRQREASPLGRVFAIANGMYDEIDAMVIVGSSVALAGIRALVGVSCDPLHNELTRAQRGSRPRIYFAGDSVDNDSISALLQRLTAPANESTPPRWAMVVISDDDPDGTVATVSAHLLNRLHDQLGEKANRLLPRYFIPFVRSESWLQRLASAVGCHEIFEVDVDVSDPLGVMALGNHLPIAMLGLDCMRWLGGAHGIKENFFDASFDNNVVMQQVVWNVLRSQQIGARTRWLNLHSDALESFGHWCQIFVAAQASDRHDRICVRSRVWPRDQFLQTAEAGTSVNVNVKVTAPRTDRLGRPECTFLDPSARRELEPTLTESNGDSLAQSLALNLVVPEIDTFVMGQLFQMWMMATEIESQLP